MLNCMALSIINDYEFLRVAREVMGAINLIDSSYIFMFIALVGTILNSKMNVLGFYLWIISNTYFGFRFLNKFEYAAGILNLIYIVLAVYGIRCWSKKKSKKVND